MRVCVVTESFLPQVNGVTNSVLRSCEQLQARGHEVLVVAPGDGPDRWGTTRVVRSPGVAMPGYPQFQLSRPWAGLASTLRQFDPDVVHLASPAVLGAQAAFLSERSGYPVVAVYQTDLAGFAGRYGLPLAEGVLWRWLRRVHTRAAVNLAPSRPAMDDLRRNGVPRVVHWPRGVDLDLFHPGHRDAALHDRYAGPGQLLVGYIGRLAHEKEVSLLADLARNDRIRLVIAGEGPQRAQLAQQIPQATFVGFQQGEQLSALFASLDVFVHTGAHETFCQSAQEALASGVPVVGPAAGGLLDLVTPGVTGYLFEPGSAPSLRASVERLLDDDAARRQMSSAARLSVADRCWTAIGEQLVTHYQQAVWHTGAVREPART